MAKIGSQNRLLIPQDIANLIKLEKGTVGIYWDELEKSIFIKNLNETNTDNCIAVRVLDNKNRIAIPHDILSLIDADISSEFILYVKKSSIYIKKKIEVNGNGFRFPFFNIILSFMI